MNIKSIKQLSVKDIKSAGGKGASLGELAKLKVNVTAGFVVLASGFEKFLEKNNLDGKIETILGKTNYKNIKAINKASDRIKNLFKKANISKNIVHEILVEYKKLGTSLVAVRSSATAEDSANMAWAGQLESYLNTGKENLLKNTKKCWASLFAPRAIAYRFERGLQAKKISVAVVVQKMVRSEKAGVAFSVHPVTQDKNQLIIEAGIGLSESVVSGKITPDSYIVSKRPKRLIEKNVQTKQVLSDDGIMRLSQLVITIEKHFKKPQDVEWCFASGKFYILQSRPITTLNK